MGMEIQRESTGSFSLAVANSTPTTARFDASGSSQFSIFMPASSSVTSLQFFSAPTATATMQPVYNSTGALTITVAQGQNYSSPDELFPHPFIGIKANATDTITIVQKR